MSILIVEGSTTARHFIVKDLQENGYDTIEAKTAQEALNLLQTIPNISLITLRVVMEDGDGFDFLKMLRTEEVKLKLRAIGNVNVPAVFITACDSDSDRLRGFQVGAVDFLQKPWPKGELVKTVNEILGNTLEYSGLTVLIVDDSAICRFFMCSCLSRMGVTVLEADDGITAYDIVSDPAQDVDLVITDLNMKNMNGDELCMKIRNNPTLKEIPVIFLSANDSESKTLSLFRIGATDYLHKPFIQEELRARLKGYFDHLRLVRSFHDAEAEQDELKLLKKQIQSLGVSKQGNPLQSLLSDANLLEQSNILPAEQQELLKNIIAAGNDLEQQIDKIKHSANNSEDVETEPIINLFEIEKDRKVTMSTSDSAAKDVVAEQPQIHIPLNEDCDAGEDLDLIRVLVVEDSPVSQSVAEKRLSGLGCLVDLAEDGEKGVQMYQASCCSQRYQIIFMDLQMPVLDGYAATQKIREYEASLPADHPWHDNPVPVIALTAASTKIELNACMAAGMDSLLQKPLAVYEAEEALEDWVGIGSGIYT